MRASSTHAHAMRNMTDNIRRSHSLPVLSSKQCTQRHMAGAPSGSHASCQHNQRAATPGPPHIWQLATHLVRCINVCAPVQQQRDHVLSAVLTGRDQRCFSILQRSSSSVRHTWLQHTTHQTACRLRRCDVCTCLGAPALRCMTWQAGGMHRYTHSRRSKQLIFVARCVYTHVRPADSCKHCCADQCILRVDLDGSMGTNQGSSSLTLPRWQATQAPKCKDNSGGSKHNRCRLCQGPVRQRTAAQYRLRNKHIHFSVHRGTWTMHSLGDTCCASIKVARRLGPPHQLRAATHIAAILDVCAPVQQQRDYVLMAAISGLPECPLFIVQQPCKPVKHNNLLAIAHQQSSARPGRPRTPVHDFASRQHAHGQATVGEASSNTCIA